MIDLSGVPPDQRQVILAAYEKHCTGRKSSHLGGKGRSASKGWAFLQHYNELLVHVELVGGRPTLFLKTEGHTTGITGVVPHLKSYIHKKKTGEGLEASPLLTAFAKEYPGLVDRRGAENYGKEYEELLGKLGLKGRMATARQVIEALFIKTGFQPEGNPAVKAFAQSASNDRLGRALSSYCDAATTVGAGGVKFRAGGLVTGPMIEHLRGVAKGLKDDGRQDTPRLFQETIATPQEIDRSLDYFCSCT